MIAEFFWDIFQPIYDGGWVMAPLFVLGLLMYGLGFYLLFALLPVKATKVSDAQCRDWVANPNLAKGQLREILEYTTVGVTTIEGVQERFEEIRLNEIPKINVNISVLVVMVAAAPLLGLLGTVLGMLTTFQGLAAGGAEKTTSLVADGIRVALITTEMGLFLAIPGTFLVYVVRSMRNGFLRLLVRLESFALQRIKERSAA